MKVPVIIDYVHMRISHDTLEDIEGEPGELAKTTMYYGCGCMVMLELVEIESPNKTHVKTPRLCTTHWKSSEQLDRLKSSNGLIQ